MLPWDYSENVIFMPATAWVLKVIQLSISNGIFLYFLSLDFLYFSLITNEHSVVALISHLATFKDRKRQISGWLDTRIILETAGMNIRCAFSGGDKFDWPFLWILIVWSWPHPFLDANATMSMMPTLQLILINCGWLDPWSSTEKTISQTTTDVESLQLTTSHIQCWYTDVIDALKMTKNGRLTLTLSICRCLTPIFILPWQPWTVLVCSWPHPWPIAHTSMSVMPRPLAKLNWLKIFAFFPYL